MFRRREGGPEVLLAHPGGPYWTRKDPGAWTIPKGKIEQGEQPLEAAIREFKEETGFDAVEPFLELGTIRQRSGKLVTAWAFEGDCDPADLHSITQSIEWPVGSGRFVEMPEIDKAEWLNLEGARQRIIPAQRPFLVTLARLLQS
jgi:predicted NUDIX family NTP pyrophosphohydrolase